MMKNYLNTMGRLLLIIRYQLTSIYLIKVIITIIQIDAKIDNIQRNIRVPLMDKDDDDVSDADLDEDLDIEANIKFKQKYDIKKQMDKTSKPKKK